MPRLVGALVLAMLAACAPAPAAPTTPAPASASSPSPAAATAAPAAPSSATTSTPTATDATHPHFAVLVTGVFDLKPVPRYEVSIIDREGNVAARASAATRPVREIALPAVSVSRTRVYFIDGESQLRSLNVDGTQGPVRPLRVGPEDQAAVAVSPDDRRIAVTLLHWGPNRSPPQAYVEDLDGGGNHRDLNVPAGRMMWPVGWRGDQIVFGLDGRNYGWPAGLCPGCAYQPRGYMVFDPATGGLQAVICAYGGPGDIVRNATPVGILCIDNRTTFPYIVTATFGWDGREVRSWLTADGRSYAATRGVLSPSGRTIANMGLFPDEPGGMYLIDERGRRSSGLEGEPSGWIGEDRVVFRPKSDVNVSAIFDLATQSVVRIGVSGTMVATIPGGYDPTP